MEILPRTVSLFLVPEPLPRLNSRSSYPQVLYKGDAEHLPPPSPGDPQSASNANDPLSGNGLFLTNLQFDEQVCGATYLIRAAGLRNANQTLNKIAEAFGPLESFKVFTPSSNVDENGLEEETTSLSHEYPPPHDSPRSKGMDSRVWEVKWGHRDDCVCALMVSGCVLIIM